MASTTYSDGLLSAENSSADIDDSMDETAALMALTALQERVKQLEMENRNLKQENLNLAKDLDEISEIAGQKVERFNYSNSRADSVLESALNTIKLYRGENEKNEVARRDIAESEEILARQRKKTQEYQSELAEMTQKVARMEEDMKEYISFVLEAIKLPSFKAFLPENESTLLTESDSFEGVDEALIDKLSEIPSSLSGCPSDKRKAAVHSLLESYFEARSIYIDLRTYQKEQHGSMRATQMSRSVQLKLKTYIALYKALERFSS